mmetsp:Transcript_60337/g.135973  ORF Transcript_60337/g.135973 Transcript_60337/m.135973 type:complete len:140 (-) Transcript_60337:174-593(-)
MGQTQCVRGACKHAGEDCCGSGGGEVKVEHQLLGAIVNGELDRAESLLQAGPAAIVNCRLQVPLSDGTYMCHSDGATPLHLACLLGHQKLAESLISKRAHIDAADERGLTPASYAQRGRHQELQKMLQERSKQANTDSR